MQLIRISQVGILALLAACATKTSEVEVETPDIDETPQEVVELEKPSEDPAKNSEPKELADKKSEATKNMDAGEGMKAKREEGKVGKADQAPVNAEQRAQADKVAENSVLLQALSTSGDKAGADSFAFDGDVSGLDGVADGQTVGSGALGGLIGAKGNQVGSAGLGSRGSGLGGGGTAEGLGGLGTKGVGAGASGYGKGGGSYGVKSASGTISASGRAGAAPKAKSVAVGYGGKAGGPKTGKKGFVVGNISTAVDTPEKVVIAENPNSTEEYTDYGINPFVKTAEDAKSTFSIDVDTASYTIARRKLNEGKMPAFQGIRVEEFVNYFDYHYDSSKAEPFIVDMEAMAHPFKDDKHILRVGLQGMEHTVESRPPLHLTFLVDVSGSMSSKDKLPLAKESMHMLVDTLREDDTVALATYAGSIAKILSPTHGDSKQKIHDAIDKLGAGGSTAMSSGLDLAYEMAWASFEPGAENRVVVLSDGDANVGNTGWQDMLKQIKSYADRGVTMSTIGFGMGNYKDTSMEQLANKGDGNNFYIDSRAQAHRVFVEDFNSSMINIARDVKIQMEFNEDVVESYRLIGYENRDIADKDFRNDRVDAGEIGSGHNVTALYEIVLTESYGDEEIATARLRYEKPGADSVATERSWNVDTSDISSKREVSDSLKIAFTAGTFAEILRKSPHVSGISLTELIEFGEKSKRRGEKDDVELINLMKKAKDLSEGVPVVSN